MKTVITVLFLLLVAVIAVPVQAQEDPNANQTATGSTSMGSSSMGSSSHGMTHKHAGHASSLVREVQQALKDKGNDPGAIDGKLGPKTKAAIRDFQKANDLKVTGRIESETRSKLGVGSSTQSSPTS